MLNGNCDRPTSADQGVYYGDPGMIETLSLQTPEVRDLAWACFSAPLLDSHSLGEDCPLYNCQLPLDGERQRWLHDLDAAPQPLLDWLADSRRGRLGLYFEQLWQFFLQRDQQVDLLAHNLPVRAAGRTLGEFDLIYYCHTRQRHVHLELAVKFYLLRPGASSAWHNWLGPNSRDRLDRKIERMRQHQLRLADTPAGAAVLNALGVSEVLREMEVKGRLFRHLHAPASAPPCTHQGLQLERWLRCAELEDFLQSRYSYGLLQRQQWLAGTVHQRALSPGDLQQGVAKELRLHGRPVQIVAVGPGGEERRYFVVPDSWPG